MTRQKKGEWNNFHLVSEVIRLDIPKNEKFLLILLANHASLENYAFPSIKRLAYYSGLSAKQVGTILNKLEKRGAFIRKKVRRNYHYTIQTENIPVLTDFNSQFDDIEMEQPNISESAHEIKAEELIDFKISEAQKLKKMDEDIEKWADQLRAKNIKKKKLPSIG